MKQIVKIAFAIGSVVIMACNKGGFKTSDTGFMYEFFTQNTAGNKAIPGDLIELDVIYKTDKDSVLFDSKKAGRPIQVVLRTPSFKGSLEEGFAMMSKDDSAAFKVNADSFFVKFLNSQLPPFITKGSLLTFNVKMKNITPKAEFEKSEKIKMDKQQVMLDSLKKVEPTMLSNYLSANNITAKPSTSGLIIISRKEGAGALIASGKKVTVNYAGYSLDGKLFDTNIEAIAKQNNVYDPNRPYDVFSFNVGQSQVIKGWDEALIQLKVSQKATLIIPSDLAYGASGAGPILPFSTLRFEIEVLSAE